MNKIVISIKDLKNDKCEITMKCDFKDNAKENVKIASLNTKMAISEALKKLSEIKK